MLTTRKKRSIKSGLEKLRNNEWRQMVIWFHTADVDDVEIIEAYLQKHEIRIGVVAKPIDKLEIALALLILNKVHSCWLFYAMFHYSFVFLFIVDNFSISHY